MPTLNHIFCFLLAVLIHLLSMILFGLFAHCRDRAEESAPALEITSVELTLTGPETASPSAAAAEQTAAAQSQQAEAPPPLDLPRPVEPPPPILPDKPSFTDLLTPPPEPVPEPVPKPRQPAPTPPTPQPAAPAQVAEKSAAASADPNAQQTATIQSSGGGTYGRVDAQPSLERTIKPNYPIGARRRGEEGTVILDALVSAGGKALSVSLVASCGFPELDAAAERAVSQARFKPAKRDGRPVESAARLTIIFRLRGQ